MNLIDEWQSIKIVINRIHKSDNNTAHQVKQVFNRTLKLLVLFTLLPFTLSSKRTKC